MWIRSLLPFLSIALTLPIVLTTAKYCGQPLGLTRGTSNQIQDDKMTGTSYVNNHAFHNGRIGDVGWCPQSGITDRHPYLQIDLMDFYLVCGFAIQGCTDPLTSAWVTRYRVQVSPQQDFWDLWNFIKPEFYGGVNATEIFYSSAERKVGRYVRIFPVSFVEKACMKMEIYGNLYISAPGQSVFVLDNADKLTYKTGHVQRLLGKSFARVNNKEFAFRWHYTKVIPRLKPLTVELRVNACVLAPYKKSEHQYISGRVREVIRGWYDVEFLIDVGHYSENSVRKRLHRFKIHELQVVFGAWCGERDFYFRMSNREPPRGLCRGKIVRVDSHLVLKAKGGKTHKLIWLSYQMKDRRPEDYVNDKTILKSDIIKRVPLMYENQYGCLMHGTSKPSSYSFSNKILQWIVFHGKVYRRDKVRLAGGTPPVCAAKERKTCDVSRIPFTVIRRGSCLWKEKLTAFGCQDEDECQTGMASCAKHAVCVNTKQFYNCKCPANFTSDNPRLHACRRQTDKCKGVVCDKNAFCKTFRGKVSCSCQEGYVGNGLQCTIDRCTKQIREACKLREICMTEGNAARCVCAPGYKAIRTTDNTTICRDVDECHQQKHQCNQHAECRNVDGSYHCKCKSGFYGNGFNCSDRTECTDPKISGKCHLHARCRDTEGSFRCECKEGYIGDGQNNCVVASECHKCHKWADCIDSQKSCQCKRGFEGDGKTCNDINECSRGLDTCPRTTGVRCVNNNGSFECVCEKGFTGDGNQKCEDINECSVPDKNECVRNAVCKNNIGSYTCRCKQGFSGDARKTCTTRNPCLKMFPDCDLPRATCAKNNTDNKYHCSCNPGYTGDGNNCIDKDECLGNILCSQHATCHNTVGSFVCQCNHGYTGRGFECYDVDECLNEDSCARQATCFNTLGSFYCVCNRGYHGNPKKKCSDLDECTITNCGYGQNCTNTEGSYRCPCVEGYVQGSHGTCKDVDECRLTERLPCGTYNLIKCENKPGAYSCRCALGYEFNRKEKECEDINECGNTKFPCVENAECVNTDGGYNCICAKGYNGDGENYCEVNGSPVALSMAAWNLRLVLILFAVVREIIVFLH